MFGNTFSGLTLMSRICYYGNNPNTARYFAYINDTRLGDHVFATLLVLEEIHLHLLQWYSR